LALVSSASFDTAVLPKPWARMYEHCRQLDRLSRCDQPLLVDNNEGLRCLHLGISQKRTCLVFIGKLLMMRYYHPRPDRRAGLVSCLVFGGDKLKRMREENPVNSQRQITTKKSEHIFAL